MNNKFPVDVLSVKKYLKKGSDAQLARIGHVNALAEEVVANKLIQDAIVEQLEEAPVVADSRPYKVYTALLTGLTTNNPTITVLENTLNGVPVVERVSNGFYRVTLNNGFSATKTISNFHVVSESGVVGAGYHDGPGAIVNSTVFFVARQLSDSAGIDAVYPGSSIEIRVYND